MSQIAPRMYRTWWPVWCRRAWWGSTESGQNLFTRGVGRRGCMGLGRRGFDDVDGAVGWGRGWGRGLGACRRDLGPDACHRSGFPGQGARRQGRRWLDDMDTPMEYGLGQRWMAPSRGGMGLGGLGPWCGRPRLWRNNGSVAADNKSVEVGLPRYTHARTHVFTHADGTYTRTNSHTNELARIHSIHAHTHARTHVHIHAHTRTHALPHTHTHTHTFRP